MRSKNESKYGHYYALLQKCIVHYDAYRGMLREAGYMKELTVIRETIATKDATIDTINGVVESMRGLQFETAAKLAHASFRQVLPSSRSENQNVLILIRRDYELPGVFKRIHFDGNDFNLLTALPHNHGYNEAALIADFEHYHDLKDVVVVPAMIHEVVAPVAPDAADQ